MKIFKARKVLKMCVLGFICLMTCPEAAMAGAASDVLMSVGLPLVQLMVLASFGWILSYITTALGHGQIAGMIKISTVFICLGIVIGVVWQGISAVAAAFGIPL